MKKQTIVPIVLGSLTLLLTTVSPVRAQGRSESDRSVAPNPYVSNTLPGTGHPTRFRKFSLGSQQNIYQGAAQQIQARRASRASVSSYIRLAGGGNPAANYFLGVQRDQQIYETSGGVGSINSQVLGIRRDLESPKPVVARFGPSEQEYATPLQRKFQQQQDAGYQQVLMEDSIRQLKKSQTESSDREQALLREMISEIKALREAIKPAMPEQ